MAGETTDKPYDLLIVGGRVIDPGSQFDGLADVAVKAGRIAAVGQTLQRDDAAEIFDAAGLLVTPGLVDTHVHVYLLPYSTGSVFLCVVLRIHAVVSAGHQGSCWLEQVRRSANESQQ